MRVNVIKNGPKGTWGFKGIEIVEVSIGEQEMHQDLATELIEAGWAEKIKEVKKEVKKPKPQKKAKK